MTSVHLANLEIKKLERVSGERNRNLVWIIYSFYNVNLNVVTSFLFIAEFTGLLVVAFRPYLTSHCPFISFEADSNQSLKAMPV